MPLWKPDQSFYPSPRMAMQGPREKLAYVAAFNPEPKNGRHDAMCVLDLDPASPTYAQIVGRTEMPGVGDELHHFGWNACSAALCPYAPHPHVERRYLIVPGLRSSRLHILDVKPDPLKPQIVKVIEAEELATRAGYSRPHTSHCGPDAIYMSAMGSGTGGGPGGIFLLDHDSFDVLGQWEVDRGPQFLAYDIWDLRGRRHLQVLEMGKEHQLAFELRPAHDPTKAYGFVCVVLSTKDLCSSIWLWYRTDNGSFAVRKIIEIPPEPADPAQLPPPLKAFKAVPALCPEISLSLDDRFLYASCWGTGDLIQYDVSDPFSPKLTGKVRLGGIVSHAPHPKGGALNGGPQMLEVSRDGRRIYATISLYPAVDAQFYPEGIRGWIAKVDANPGGGLAIDPNFFVPFQGERPHQIRLEGGDSSSDSFCYP